VPLLIACSDLSTLSRDTTQDSIVLSFVLRLSAWEDVHLFFCQRVPPNDVLPRHPTNGR